MTKAEEELAKAWEEKEPGAGDSSVAKVRALASTTTRRCCSLQIQGKKGTKGGEEVDGERWGGKPVGQSAGESKQPPEGSSKQQDREPPRLRRDRRTATTTSFLRSHRKGTSRPPKGPKGDKPPVKTPKEDKPPPKGPKVDKPAGEDAEG